MSPIFDITCDQVPSISFIRPSIFRALIKFAYATFLSSTVSPAERLSSFITLSALIPFASTASISIPSLLRKDSLFPSVINSRVAYTTSLNPLRATPERPAPASPIMSMSCLVSPVASVTIDSVPNNSTPRVLNCKAASFNASTSKGVFAAYFITSLSFSAPRVASLYNAPKVILALSTSSPTRIISLDRPTMGLSNALPVFIRDLPI